MSDGRPAPAHAGNSARGSLRENRDAPRAPSSSGEARATSLPRVAVVCDLLEERWPSMDLVGEMVLEHLRREHAAELRADAVRPTMRRRTAGLSSKLGGPAARALFNADRLANRFWDYPRTLRRMRDRFDLFHIVDHSYAQLVHELPPGRAVVTCHDLDTFRCVLEPEREPRGRAFRAMVGRTLAGFRAAARVLCVSGATRDAVLAHGLLPPERVVVAPNGVHPSCTTRPDPEADAEAERLLGVRDARVPVVLHVGSTIARKRLDVLLRLYAELRRVVPGVCLARVGGFTPEQGRLRAQLGLDGAVRELPPLDRRVLAAVYRRASVLVQPSESEGFGLPVVEAMACGTPVVASEIAVLREVGGAAATYCPVGDVPRWTAAVEALLAERAADPEGWARRRAAAVARAGVFSWSENARRTVEVYMEVLGSAPA